MPQFVRWSMAIGFVAFVLGGCGSPRASVTGKVTFEGKPLTSKQSGLVVAFSGGDGQPVIAPVAADGNYAATGVMHGMNRISVYWLPPPGMNPASQRKSDNVQSPQPGHETPAVTANTQPIKGPIPERYADPNTSSLKYTVNAGSNTYDIDLKKQ